MQRILKLRDYGNNITNKTLGNEIYDAAALLLLDGSIEIDFSGVSTITTFCAKSIFGRLYKDLGTDNFYNKVVISNANSDIQIIIKEGLLDYINDTAG